MLKGKYISITINGIELDLSRSSANDVDAIMGVLQPAAGTTATLDQTTFANLASNPALAQYFPDGVSISFLDAMIGKSGTAKVVSATVGGQINLNQLPLLGSILPAGATFSIDSLQLAIATGTLSPGATIGLNNIVPPGIKPLPNLLREGLNFSTQLTLAGQTLTLGSEPQTNIPQSSTPPGNGTPAPPTTSLPPGSIAINKTLGPIHISQFQISLDNQGKVVNPTVGVDASIQFGPLTLGVEGLDLTLPIDGGNFDVSLKGLSLNYQSNTVGIAGAFLNQSGVYNGLFTLSLSKLQISAIGSYAEENGQASVFIYALLDEPLGGPAFCFVEGLALTFGYNRNFIPPPINEVANFPLIAAASGTAAPPQDEAGLGTMMQELEQSIVPDIGEQFIGIGIKFNTFKVINSFALLIAKFGNDLVFDLLGESTYCAPDPNTTNPVANVQLVLVGSYTPADETLMIRGQLSPGSFVLSKDCHLQGGFAIGNWFQEGDFVYSFGGYASNYTPPSHYPQNIPQLGFLWQVDSDLSIKGGGYWAVVPNQVMLGGYLQAVYTSDWVHASFSIAAAFDVQWSPFHYNASFTVSFSLHVRVDLLFCSEWLGFDVSKSLEIWGPPFGGDVSISLAVATVHISFGAPATLAPLLSWSAFAAAHLPVANPSATADSAAANPLVSITIESGLLREKNGIAVINPKEFVIATSSVIPSNTVSINGAAANAGPVNPYEFEIVPMGTTLTGISNHSVHTIAIKNAQNNPVENAQFEVNYATKNAPASIWLNTDSSTVAGGLSSLAFGSSIVPKVPVIAPSQGPVLREDLANEPFNGYDSQWDENASFSGTLTPADSVIPNQIDSNLYGELSSVFKLPSVTEPTAAGLQSRLTDMGQSNIFLGTLTPANS